MLKRAAIIAAGAAITLWQYRAGLARVGTIDGGILLFPLLLLVIYLARGVYRDLAAERRRQTCELKHRRGLY